MPVVVRLLASSIPAHSPRTTTPEMPADLSAPPVEAVKQGDGSYLAKLEDGSTMRWTKRPDGTWRKPEHVRAGWVGDLEQATYKPKGVVIEEQRQVQMQAQIDNGQRGRVPGAPLENGQGDKKGANERKKEKRKEKAHANDDARVAALSGRCPEEADNNNTTVDNTASDVVKNTTVDNTTVDNTAANAVKNEKNIRKRLRQIEELEEKQKGGEALNEDQLQKVASKKKLQAELKAVLAGEPVAVTEAPALSVSKPAAVTKAPPLPSAGYPAAAAETAPPSAAKQHAVAAVPSPAAAAAAPVVEAAIAPDATAAGQTTKSRKAIEKKLRQIAEIEEKERAGETLNDDQKAKLAAKKQLEADLKSC